MVIADNKNKDKHKGIPTEFNFPYTVEAFRLQSRYRFARESFISETYYSILEVLSLSLRSRERLSSFNKNNRDNRAGEIKLNTSFRGANFFFFLLE